MARSRFRSKRKVSGGRYHSARGKRRHELARLPTLTRLGEKKAKLLRTRSAHLKQILFSAKEVNVTDKSGKSRKTEILNVIENPANPNLVRRNIITKGAIVETKLGKARITSRPGQEGSLNAVLI